jgi:hypothetical protein
MNINSNKVERPERMKLSEKRDRQYEKFYKNLKILLGATQLSSVEITIAMGWELKGKRLQDLSYGRGTPKLDEIIALTKFFNITLDDLINKEAKIIFQ